MAGLIPNEGEGRMIRLITNATTTVSTGENLRLALFSNDVTPTSTMTTADFVCDPPVIADGGPNTYATLTSGNWTVTPGSPTIAAYTSGIQFKLVTFENSTGDFQIYGYYLYGSQTSSLMGAERFPAAPYQLSLTSDSVFVTPKFTLEGS